MSNPSNAQKPAPRKIGEGVAHAAFCQGFKELGNIIPAFPQTTPYVDEPGQMFNIPPQGVSQQTGFSQPVSVNQTPLKSPLSQHPSIIDQHLVDIGVNTPQQPGLTVQSPEPSKTDPTSLIDHHLADIQQHTPEVQEPDMEIQP